MSESRKGMAYAGAAYGLWGLFPLYWKLLMPASPVEILAHRLVWSVLVVAVIALALRHFGVIRELFADPRRLGLVTLAAVFISINWTTYIFGVNSGHVVETSLGYFINPLVSVVMGVLLLGERLRLWQWLAVATGAIAVMVLTFDYGRLPWIALILGFSFGFYGLIKKQVKLPADVGLFAETAVLAVPAIGFLFWLEATGDGTFASISLWHSLFLASAGIATAVPLLFFAGAASRLPLVTLGMTQYIAPTLQFAIGVLVYAEPMPTVRIIGFSLVWLALVIFTIDAVRAARRRAPLVPVVAVAPVE